MSTKLAKILSIIFFPGLIPVFLLGIIFSIAPYIVGLGEIQFRYKLLILGFIALYSFIFPALFTFWLYKRGKVQDLELSQLKDRRLPYASAVVFLGFLAYTFYYKSPELISVAIILGAIGLIVFIIAIVSLFWQVSAHAAGMGGLVGFLAALLLIYDEQLLKIPFFISLPLAGMVISSRLKLGAHTPSQTYIGFFIGLAISLASAFFV